MAIKKRPRLDPTHEWQQRALLVEGPEQRAYEVMRPCVLCGQSPAGRARQTGVPRRSLYRQVGRFDQLGLLSLFAPVEERAPPDALPAPVPAYRRPQGRVPAFHLHQLACICYVAEGRRTGPHTIQRVLADKAGPITTLPARPTAAWRSSACMRRAGGSAPSPPTWV